MLLLLLLLDNFLGSFDKSAEREVGNSIIGKVLALKRNRIPTEYCTWKESQHVLGGAM